MDAFIGEIRLFPYNFVPKDWAICNGEMLLISDYPQLYSVIGNLYGGTAGKNFNLPNFNSRVALGAHDALRVGTALGADRITMHPDNFCSHTHSVRARDGSASAAAKDTPTVNDYLAQPRNILLYNNDEPKDSSGTLDIGTIIEFGVKSPVVQRNNMQPFLALMYCISLYGESPFDVH